MPLGIDAPRHAVLDVENRRHQIEGIEADADLMVEHLLVSGLACAEGMYQPAEVLEFGARALHQMRGEAVQPMRTEELAEGFLCRNGRAVERMDTVERCERMRDEQPHQMVLRPPGSAYPKPFCHGYLKAERFCQIGK